MFLTRQSRRERNNQMQKVLLAALLFLLGSAAVHAQATGIINCAAATTTGSASVVPQLTWSTSPAATSCTASGDWSGTLAAAGTQTLPAVTKSATYNLTCSWVDNKAVVNWAAVTQNTNGLPYTDAKMSRIYYSTSQTLPFTSHIDITNPALVTG